MDPKLFALLAQQQPQQPAGQAPLPSGNAGAGSSHVDALKAAQLKQGLGSATNWGNLFQLLQGK